MLMAHQDVVPIAPGTEKDWLAEPFAGTIRDGYIWGRGAWDDKGDLLGILEAVETLLAHGYTPRQTIYLASGQDEEVGGRKGAMQIAALLKSRGVRLEFVLDEGMLITDGVMKGITQPLALIGVAEKGSMTVSLSATAIPGHSSMPPKETAIGMLSSAIAKLENAQMPASIGGVATEMLDTIAPEMSGMNRIVLSNRWLFGPLVRYGLEKGPTTNALVRTTTAPTIFNAGNKENVLPGYAKAYVNFRLLPGDTKADVLKHVDEVIGNPAIVAKPTDEISTEASPVSSSASRSYRLINRTIREIFPGTLVAPALLVGATDSRYMTDIAEQVYRFSPVRANAEDLHRFHGTNERMSVANYTELVAFYYRLLSADGAISQ
jgi:carboxypeptidase PM20D1